MLLLVRSALNAAASLSYDRADAGSDCLCLRHGACRGGERQDKRAVERSRVRAAAEAEDGNQVPIADSDILLQVALSSAIEGLRASRGEVDAHDESMTLRSYRACLRRRRDHGGSGDHGRLTGEDGVVASRSKRASVQAHLRLPPNEDFARGDEVGEKGCGAIAGHLRRYSADGRRFLVIHGDEFDGVIRYAKVLAHLGDWAYDAALVLNRWFNAARRRFGYPYWSLSQWLKRQVKEAVKAIDRFELALAGEARRRGLDGVICGHIHHAEMREVHGITYMNDGDWVESCTALVEHADGRFELVDWAREMALGHAGRPEAATMAMARA